MRFIYFSLIVLLFFNCSNSRENSNKLIDFVPKNTSVIIKTSNLDGLKSSIKNSDFLQKLSQTKAYTNLELKLESLSLLKPKGNVLICFSEDEKDSLQYTIITKYHKDLFKRDSLKNYTEEDLIFENKTITKSTLKTQLFYSTVMDSVFVASSSKNIIDSIFETSETSIELEKIYNTTANNKTFSVIIKANNPFITSFFLENSMPLKTFTNYMALETEINQDEILIHGITKASDSLKSFINVFKNTVPKENQVARIAPSNSDGFMSFTFHNYNILESNLAAFNKKDSVTTTTTLFDNISEVGIIYQDEKPAIVLNSSDIIATEDALISEQNTIETYRQIDIYSFSTPQIFSETFYPLVTFKNATKYCMVDNFFVFADDLETLQNIIANYQNKTTLIENDSFNQIQSQLSDASSLLVVTTPAKLDPILNKNFKEDIQISLNNYNISALQFIYDTHFAHVNGIVKKSKTKALENAVSEELNIKLERDLLTKPQFVTNHITKEKEIVVQDVGNNLYLISNKGKILWKKQLQGAILGTIEQIDIYKNGKLQLAFATTNSVYVIDRNGDHVSPFPLKFNDNITQPLAVFDYDKNKDYRLLVTQGKNVLMYNTSAKTVNGFNFKTADNIVTSQPKHFRIAGKDYLVLKTQSKLYILDRTGNIRVTSKTSQSYSNQPVFLYNNNFTTTSLNGNLISVDTKGGVSTESLNLSEKHGVDASSKTLITLSDNKLNIKNKTVELDFGSYSNPQLFYIKDKIYVAVTDLQSQKIYLFDSQATLLPNFPVYGSSSIDLGSIDKDRNLEFVTKGESNSIVLYQLN